MHAYAHMRNRTFPFLRVCAFTHLHIWVDTAQDAGAGPRWMTMEGWHMGRKESAGNQAGTARMTVGDRFWARRIRPIFDDGDLTLEQKSVFCCIVARDPMSVAIECPARDIAAAEAGLPRRDYDEALDALERGGYIVDIVTPYGEDRDGELCMVPIPADIVKEGVQRRG